MAHTETNESVIANEEVKKICAINRDTVHKICSGQVVFNLAVAVKELVENAIDAGATNIDIRLREYGSELVEVSDNGFGVEEQNFSGLTLKHFTSKLREFSDLESVSTLGFRGEALSSLCALSNLSITTRHKSIEYATKIDYDINGHIKTKNKCARQIGTTVTLTKLFSSLPVRHKEFIKNLKREFSKMCQLLYAYCLIAEGVRILCTNQTKKGSRTTLVATQGSNTIKENIICIFGIKQLDSLIEIKIHEPDEKYLEDFGVKRRPEDVLPFSFYGFISKCTHGSGRSASDRQFYYINSRPCEPTKIMKLVNEVYKYFNSSQYPVILLNIKTSQSQIDVNVTPDKRQVFMEQEKLLLATLKTSLLEMFKEFPSTFRMQNLDVTKEVDKKNFAETLKEWSKTTEKILEKNNRGVKRSNETKPKGIMGFIHEKRKKIDEDFAENLSIPSSSDDEDKQIDKFIKESYNSSDSEPDLSMIPKPKTKLINKTLNTFVQKTKPTLDNELKSSLNEFKNDFNCYKITVENSAAKTIDVGGIEIYERKKQTKEVHETTDIQDRETYEKRETIRNQDSETYERRETIGNQDSETYERRETIDNQDSEVYENKKQMHETDKVQKQQTKIKSEDFVEDSETFSNSKIEIISNNDLKTEEKPFYSQPSSSQNNSQSSNSSKNSVIDLKIPDLQSILNKMRLSQDEIRPSQVRFRSELTSKDAETELDRHISKDMFKKMEIVGQFNKGFIIARLDSDLFIIDQHATDEKYNFETLQKTTVIQNQQLVVPKSLELTAANELLLIDNIEVFKKNGFAFSIDETAEPRHKVKLTAMPVSKNWEFGKEAIDELLFMLQEDSATDNMRPSGIRAMFASRACRKSVMIGSALSVSDMRRLVDHMGQIDQPWNCPHGRPTMRHLINLDLLKMGDNSSSSEEEDEDD